MYPLYHERTKHIEVNCYFIKEVVMNGEVCTPHIKSTKKLVDLFTRALSNVTLRNYDDCFLPPPLPLTNFFFF